MSMDNDWLGMGGCSAWCRYSLSHVGACLDFTLTFDSSPIKGEGDMVVRHCPHRPSP